MVNRLLAVAAAILLPTAAWAGIVAPRVVAEAPAMGEPGLILLGLCLVGAGLAALRRR